MISILKITGWIILGILSIVGILIGKLAWNSIKDLFKNPEKPKEIQQKNKVENTESENKK